MQSLWVINFQVFRRDLVQALRRKRPHLDLDDVILHHDNVPAHRAHDTELEICLLGFSLLPYSPYRAPLDFRLFPDLKKGLRCQRFETPLELRTRASEIVSLFIQTDQFKVSFDQGIHRHKKCVATEGNYVKTVYRT
jgi:hypothetical protein